VDIEHVRRKLARHRPDPALEGEHEKAAVAVVLREGPRSAEVLLIERAVHEHDPWSGHMAFPGGRMDRGDASTRETAARETFEEVGIQLAGAEYLGHVDELVGNRRFASRLAVSAHAFHLDAHQPFALDPKEVQHALWFPLAGLHDTHRQVEHVVPELPDVRFPGVVVGLPDRHVVWGLTFRFLDRMLAVLENPFRRTWGNVERYLERFEREQRGERGHEG
jgi:8-oxo-dGTP pyrophosphatase MutT (NUDIX family)